MKKILNKSLFLFILLMSICLITKAQLLEKNVTWDRLQSAQTTTSGTLIKTEDTKGGALSENILGSYQDGYLKHSILTTDNDYYIGLAVPNYKTTRYAIDYAFRVYKTKLYIYERGRFKQSCGIISVGENISVERVGSNIIYKKGELVLRTIETDPKYELKVDASLNKAIEIGTTLATFDRELQVITEIRHIKNCDEVIDACIALDIKGGKAPYYIIRKNMEGSYVVEDIPESKYKLCGYNQVGIFPWIVFDEAGSNLGTVVAALNGKDVKEIQKALKENKYQAQVIYPAIGYELDWQDVVGVDIKGFDENQNEIDPSVLTAATSLSLISASSGTEENWVTQGIRSTKILEATHIGWLEYQERKSIGSFIFGFSIDNDFKAKTATYDSTINTIENGMSNIQYGFGVQEKLGEKKVIAIYEGRPLATYGILLPEDKLRVSKEKIEGILYTAYYKNDLLLKTVPITDEKLYIDFFIGKGELYGTFNTNINHCPPPDVAPTPIPPYATLKKKLDGGYYTVANNDLRFKYFEKYNTDKVDVKIYDQNRVIQESSEFQGEIKYKMNWLNLNVSGLDYGYYILEVTNEKGETLYLRFKKT